MLLNSNDFNRIIIIYTIQLIFSGIFILLAYKILKRNRNRLTLTLSGFYISLSIGFILNALYPPLENEIVVYIIYVVAAYFVVLSPIFLILFNISLLKTTKEIFPRRLIIFIITYAVSLILCLNLSGGLTMVKNLTWRPLFSWVFLIIVYFFITIFILIPLLITSIKLFKSFQDIILKKKLKFFIVGIFGLIFSLYGMILYNTWEDPLFRSLWSITTSVIIILSAGLIYYAWVHRL